MNSEVPTINTRCTVTAFDLSMRRLIFTLWLIWGGQLFAQYTLDVECITCTDEFQKDFDDSLSVIRYLQERKINFWRQGFAEASIDSLSFEKKKAHAKLHLGGKYSLAIINLDSIPEMLRPQGAYLSENEVRFSPIELANYLSQILAQAMQNGYPLADVSLDEIQLTKERLTAKIKLKKGIFLRYGVPKITGNADVKPSFIQHYLRLSEGQAFDVRDIRTIQQKLRALDFLALDGAPRIRFLGNEAIIQLKLKEKKANQFHFLIGVLPNHEETKKLLLVGNALVDFKNMLGYGERFYLKFDQTRPQTQRLQLQSDFPYPFGLPLGVDASFDLYKRDSAYLDVNGQLAVRYFLKGQNYFKVFWQSSRSNLLTINKNQLITSGKLPANLDFKSNLFGLEYGFSKLDYRFNPRKGLDFRLSMGGGLLTHPHNPKITEITLPNEPEFSFAAQYDSLYPKSWQIRSQAVIHAYLPLFKHSVLAFGNQTGWQHSPTKITDNQLYKIGGNRILRGFDEESVLASFYNVSTIEYRLLVGATSYLYAFGDYGLTASPQIPESTGFSPQTYLGLGAGLSFQTKAGVFRISYALGKQNSNPLDTRSAKIHLGYQSVF